MWFFNKFKRKDKPYSSTYKFPPEIKVFFDALRDCHLKNQAEYFANLKKLAGNYPEEPVFWLFAGDILRDKNPEKALEFHRDVLFRPGTAGIFRSMVLEHIARDYILLKQNQKAVSVLKDAIKCSNYPAASLLLSEVYESDGNFDAVADEIKRYLSMNDSQTETMLHRCYARAVIRFFGKVENGRDLSQKWLGIYAKKCSDPTQSAAAEYLGFLIESNLKKATNCLKKLVEIGEEQEIFGRMMLLLFPQCSEINYSVEGKYKELFHILLNKNLKYTDPADDNKELLITKKLTLRNQLDEQTFAVLDAVLPDAKLFKCAECGREMNAIMPVCPDCQKITGRKFS